MNRLQQLVRDRMDERGMSYRELAEKAGVASSTIHSLVTRPYDRQTPQPETLEGLARGLDLPYDVLERAAAGVAGYRVEDVPSLDPDVEIVAALAGQLDPDGRRELTRIAQIWLDQQGRGRKGRRGKK
jgi:transcriptional regulator with XRE-family HTH domain